MTQQQAPVPRVGTTDTWRVTITSDVEGDEPQVLMMRGSFDPMVIRMHAGWIANAQRQRVVDAWGEEHAPNFEITGIEPIEPSGQPISFRPHPNAKPIDLERYLKMEPTKIPKPALPTKPRPGIPAARPGTAAGDALLKRQQESQEK